MKVYVLFGPGDYGDEDRAVISVHESLQKARFAGDDHAEHPLKWTGGEWSYCGDYEITAHDLQLSIPHLRSAEPHPELARMLNESKLVTDPMEWD